MTHRRSIVAELGADADPITLHTYAILDKKGRSMIERIRLALAQRKAQGVLLRNLAEARAKAIASNRQLAASFAANVSPIIRRIQAADGSSYRIAAAFNAMSVATAAVAHGGEHHGEGHGAARNGMAFGVSLVGGQVSQGRG